MKTLRDALVVLALMLLVLSVRVSPLDGTPELTPEVQAAGVAESALPRAELHPVAFTDTETVEETAEWTRDGGTVELDRVLPGGIRIIVTGSEDTVNGEVLIEIGGADAVGRQLHVTPKLIDPPDSSLSNALKVEMREIVIDSERSCIRTEPPPSDSARSTC
jgi:hypothetical protein